MKEKLDLAAEIRDAFKFTMTPIESMDALADAATRNTRGPWGHWKLIVESWGRYLVHTRERGDQGYSIRLDDLRNRDDALHWIRHVGRKAEAWMPDGDKVDFAVGIVALVLFGDLPDLAPVPPMPPVVYFLRGESTGRIKIGITTDLAKRLGAIRRMSADRLELLAIVLGDAATERELHARFATIRTHGEWFEATPELLAYIDAVRFGSKP